MKMGYFATGVYMFSDAITVIEDVYWDQCTCECTDISYIIVCLQGHGGGCGGIGEVERRRY